jgi:hypothetical protein
LGAFIFLGYKKDKAKQEKAQKEIARDTKLYENIKRGKREYDWRQNQENYSNYLKQQQHRALLFETADMVAFNLEHFAEFRISFYFKDINEYGIYSFFVGNDPDIDVFETFYRSDAEFKKEQILICDDE